MLTPHEAAVEHLKTLNRSDHPEVERVLAVVRQYPVDLQRECEAEMKRSGQVAAIDPIKAVADRQAVEIQELLDALTSPATDAGTWRNQPSSFDLMHEVRGPATDPAVLASKPFKIAADAHPPGWTQHEAAGGPQFIDSATPEHPLGLPIDQQLREAAAADDERQRALDDLAHEPPAPAALDENHPAL